MPANGSCDGEGGPRLRKLALNTLALFAAATTFGGHTVVADATSHGARSQAAFVPAAMPARRDLSLNTGLVQGRGHRLGPAGLDRTHHSRSRLSLPVINAPNRKHGAATMALRDADSSSGSPERNQMTRMIKDFVTQRAVQTYLVTLEQVGERSDFDWIEGFQGHHGLVNVHGYGALRVEWKEYLSGMMRLPEQTITKKTEFYRGGSKDNPYIQPQVREYSTTISPRKLCNTVMELRSQVSSEWAQDLQLIALENAEHWRHHLAVVTNGTDPELALQHRLIEPRETDSALRQDNYDLLEKYCTHVACTQVAMELAAKTEDEHQAMWLKSYMEEKASFHSTGTRGQGRQFIKDMLEEPPRVITMTLSNDETRTMKLIDPLDIAARVMAQRQVVAERWLEALEDTEEDQLNIHRSFMTDCLSMDTILARLEKLL